MRWHLGSIPQSADFQTDEHWRSLREPSPWMFQVLAAPIAGIAGISIALLWINLTPLGNPEVTLTDFTLSIAGIPFLFLFHELVHTVTHPGRGLSRRSILGCWPSRVMLYAHYDGELTRNRFLAILLMPTAIISLAPLLVAIACQAHAPLAAFYSILNATGSCGDLLGAILIWWQVPAQAVTRNQGWWTYWKSQP